MSAPLSHWCLGLEAVVMTRFANLAFWLYAGGVAAASTYASMAWTANRYGEQYLFASLDGLEWAILLFGLVQFFGLFVMMPLFRRTEIERDELTEKTRELQIEASTDPLTGLHNRRYFEQALDEYLAAFARANAPLGLLTLDLDHFKAVNDNYGHDAGDRVLKQLAQLLKDLTREHDIVARTGGEEFTILAPFATADQVRPFAERLCRMVGQMRIDLDRVVLRPTVSIGVATSLENVRDSKALIKLSDERLYQAKEQGRNRVCAGMLEAA